ncbi:MAG: hypothetical protein RPU61_14505 [Candidatus Sedimenticola sp. (ex Thyasira tokunagai)]
MSSHTPGKWKAHHIPASPYITERWEIHWSKDGECVAEIIHSEADAVLMAESKNLLEALESAVEWFKKLDDWSGVGDPDLDQMQAAIAKAKGKS